MMEMSVFIRNLKIPDLRLPEKDDKRDSDRRFCNCSLEQIQGKFTTILADPPWRFLNRTARMSPEYKKNFRYPTMDLKEIMGLPVSNLAVENSHLYLWVPNALVGEGLKVMEAWGYTYKTNLVWIKTTERGHTHRGGTGFYFRNASELLFFGVRGNLRTSEAGRMQCNVIASKRRKHSRKPDCVYEIIELCSPGPYLEMFARFSRPGWVQWGNEITKQETGETQ